ncbi:MAG: hypothetical protein ACRBCK_03140 [Alphaproteobacteria bacterium]
MAKTINKEFLNASGQLCQRMSLERILETRDEAHEKLQKFIIDCRKNFSLGAVHVGKDKDLATAENKANRDYDGDMTRVLDYVRSMGVVSNPDSVMEMHEALSDRNSDIMLKHGIVMASANNLFEDPKDFTGYRCLNYKLAIPVGNNEVFDKEHHIVELQIVAKQLEALYKVTHPFKRKAEDLYTEKENLEIAFEELHGTPESLHDLADTGDLSPEMHGVLENHERQIKAIKTEMSKNQAACRYHNGTTARDAGYDELLDPASRSKHEVSRTREQKLEAHAYELLFDRIEPE